MANPRLFAIHELNPLVAESAFGTPGVAATLELLAAPLEDALEARLGFAVRKPLPMAPTLDLGTPAGRRWAVLLRHVVDAAMPCGLLAHPLIAEPLQEMLLDGLLRVIDHP